MVLQSVRQGFARSALEKKLAFNASAARAHEANQAPQGHQAFKLLYDEVYGLMEQYALVYMVPGKVPEAGQEVVRVTPNLVGGMDEKVFVFTEDDVKQGTAAALQSSMAMLFSQYPALGILRARTFPPPVAAVLDGSAAKANGLKLSTQLLWMLRVSLAGGVMVGLYHATVHMMSRWFGG